MLCCNLCGVHWAFKIASGGGGPGGAAGARQKQAKAGKSRQKQKSRVSVSVWSVGEGLQWQVSIGIDEGRRRSKVR